MSSMNNPMFQLPSMTFRPTANPYAYSANAANRLNFDGLGSGTLGSGLSGNQQSGFGGSTTPQMMGAAAQYTPPPQPGQPKTEKPDTSPKGTGTPFDDRGGPAPAGTASGVAAAVASTDDVPTLLELLHEVSNINLPNAVSAELQGLIRTKLKRLHVEEYQKAKEAQRQTWDANAKRRKERWEAAHPTRKPTPAPTPAPAPQPVRTMEDPYLQALYNGEITPDQYRQLTEGQATPAAPAIAPKAPVNTTRDDLAAHLAAQDETIATLSVRDEDTKREARGMLERGEITPAQYRALTGLNAPTPTPTTTAAPAKRTSARNWEDSMPKTFEPDPNPRLSSKAKLRDVESRFNVYMTNLRAALNNGDISANDFMVRHDAAMKNYQAVRNMFGDMDTSFPPQEPYRPLGPTTADLYPNGYPEELGVLGRVGNSAFGQGVESFGNWLKSLV